MSFTGSVRLTHIPSFQTHLAANNFGEFEFDVRDWMVTHKLYLLPLSDSRYDTIHVVSLPSHLIPFLFSSALSPSSVHLHLCLSAVTKEMKLVLLSACGLGKSWQSIESWVQDVFRISTRISRDPLKFGWSSSPDAIPSMPSSRGQ